LWRTTSTVKHILVTTFALLLKRKKMFDKKTPLSPTPTNTTPNGAIPAPSFLPNAFVSMGAATAAARATAAGSFAQGQFEQVQLLASEGSISIRLCAILGGLALIVTSVLGFTQRFVSFHWVGAILGLYTLGLGCIMILLEGKQSSFLGDLESNLYKYALFVKYVWGRGILYFLAGTLEMAQAGIGIVNAWELLVGIFVMLVGIAFIVVGGRAASKLDGLRCKQFSPQTLQSEFYIASEGTAHVNITQFRALLQNLDVEQLDSREWETAFLQVEKTDRDAISLDEFQHWWNIGK